MEVLKGLFSFLMPVGVDIGLTLLYFGGITAFIALGIWMLPFVAAAVVLGFIGLGLRYAIPAFLRFIVNHIIESHIKSVLIDSDPEKTQLKKWLSIAKNDETENIWQFQFKNKNSLVQETARESKRELYIYRKSFFKKDERHLYKSQDYLKEILHIWHEKHYLKPFTLPELTFYELFILRLKKFVGLKYEFFNENNVFSDEKIFHELKAALYPENSISTISQPFSNMPTTDNNVNPKFQDLSVSIREDFTPVEILEPSHVNNIMAGNNLWGLIPEQLKPAVLDTSSVPQHLRVWKRQGQAQLQRQIAMTQHHEVDVDRQVSQAVAAHADQSLEVNMNVTIEQSNILKKGMHQWLDYSTVLSFSECVKKHDIYADQGGGVPALQFSAYRFYYERLYSLMVLQLKYERKKEVKEDDVLISKEAWFLLSEAIKKSASGVANREGLRNLETLPLGFFVEEDLNGKFVLKFSPQLRKHELKISTEAHFRSDWYAVVYPKQAKKSKSKNNKTTSNNDSSTVISLNTIQKEFIDSLKEHSEYKKISIALRKIYDHDTNGKYYVELINVLIKFKNSKVNILQKNFKNEIRECPLFDCFIEHYLIPIEVGNEFNSSETMMYLNRLCELSSAELYLFFNTQKLDFREKCGDLFYFIDFFRVRKLNFPVFDPKKNYSISV